ncbi:MAG: hypothetical protein V4850_23350 [Myxococcota bacterium]
MLLIFLACTGSEKPEDTAPTETSPIGVGDGSPESVGWTSILDGNDDLTDPRDLGFDEDGRLWVANREDDATFTINAPGTDAQENERRVDPYAMHFMEETAAFSFDGNGQFGSCGESRNTYNGQSTPNDYSGPVLWTTNLDIFANVDPIGLGSHLDMLHESPNCVGIAWESDNIYWVFDGRNSNIVRYDFQGDHGPGMDDHSDGIVRRLTEVEVSFERDAPGHMVIDHDTGLLYVADTGNGRVLWIDTASGDEGGRLDASDPGVKHREWDGADWGVLVEGLDKPGGIALGDGRLFVGEWGTGVIFEFDLDGTEIRSLDTGFGAEALHGIELGPDGQLWVVDNGAAAVFRIDP